MRVSCLTALVGSVRGSFSCNAAPLALGLALLCTNGCVTMYKGAAKPVDPATLTQEQGWTRVSNMTLVQQEQAKDCGAAAAAMVLTHWTRPTTLAEMHALAPPMTDDGLRARDVRDMFRARGLRSFVIEGKVTDLEHEIGEGRPVVVGTLKRISDDRALSHFEVVVALNPDHKKIVTLDPSLGWRQSTYADFEQEWALSDHTTIVALPPVETLSVGGIFQENSRGTREGRPGGDLTPRPPLHRGETAAERGCLGGEGEHHRQATCVLWEAAPRCSRRPQEKRDEPQQARRFVHQPGTARAARRGVSQRRGEPDLSATSTVWHPLSAASFCGGEGDGG